METLVLNKHNKTEYEPAHSCEHLLNATIPEDASETLRIVRIG